MTAILGDILHHARMGLILSRQGAAVESVWSTQPSAQYAWLGYRADDKTTGVRGFQTVNHGLIEADTATAGIYRPGLFAVGDVAAGPDQVSNTPYS